MKKIDNNNEEKRKKLKKIGYPCLILGIILVIIAFIDFFSSINDFGRPSLFFLFFLAFPLIFVGVTCLLYAYIGKVARYTASQIAPVQKDVVNYILDETKETIGEVASSIRGETTICSNCNAENSADAEYCKNCGKSINKQCKYCNNINDNDAKFCDKCGKELD